MGYWNRIPSVLGGRRLILLLGALYILIAIGRATVHTISGTPITPILVITTFIGGSGLVLFVGGYRLPETDVHPQFYSTIATWCLIGIGTMVVVLTLYHVQPDTDITEPNRSVPILTGFSAVAGFGVGTNAAKAKTSTLELKRQNRKLQQIQDRLEESNNRLAESNERLEQFAYAASHDLQEPLRMVSSYLRLIENRYGDELDKDGEEFLEYAIDGAERMSAMIEGLLEYSRVDTQGKPLEPVDLEAVLSESLQDLELQIEENDAIIEVEELPRVKGDASQLRQLFQNLISNGIEYSGDERPRIAISAEQNGEECVISVHDNGIGIHPEDQDQIFEVFHRLHSHDEHAGTGIGLALCQRIVERHGGEIWADSEPGEGSTFVFTLPAATDRNSAQSSPVLT
ncbi:ATP-binding protein [Natrialba sp. SSL1]|uniref:ATP-binding protein n=1 Tax=Natrialba sp. SSL1 TaxID=1869245 RepID=UPI0008F950D5|nr:ATP-binding protein [Natrialba sp. SSL1]OIB58932.1 histidine kinase [Natrialba sp. SSL1]